MGRLDVRGQSIRRLKGIGSNLCAKTFSAMMAIRGDPRIGNRRYRPDIRDAIAPALVL
ncbi:hypothetical protein PGT21_008255 [Puccinia graminis f. sp. tritici]|uniref:Uncharacterized protein n=1 Tax=Puccinia graminis f. sp. tritici TaxID=56615 RepID=A0A5B0PQQ7_PUCGR|nr:hypothetical protein PGT21_008255 [Puccinia graminis f. sp. tritici]